jgi:hypothetical protein
MCLLGLACAVAINAGCAATQDDEGPDNDVVDPESAGELGDEADAQSVASALSTLEYDETARVSPQFCAANTQTRYGCGAAGLVSGTDRRILDVFDAHRDGFSAGMYWQVRNRDGRVVRHGICRNRLGVGWGRCVKSMQAPFSQLRFKIGGCDQQATGHCNRVSDYRGWSPWFP